METFYEVMRRQGISRRSFLKYGSLTATSLGPDGATLFFLGDQKFVVQPVDAALRALGGPRVEARPQAGRPLPWRPASSCSSR